MSITTITLSTATSSTPGNSQMVLLNYIGGKPTTVQIISTVATSSIAFTVQYTLDDPMKLGGSSLAFWSFLSSSYNDTGVTNTSGSIFASSTSSPDGLIFSFLSPIAAVRIGSTNMLNGPLLMRVAQGDGW